MSDDAETDADSAGLDTDRITALLEDWYHLPALALIFAFMVWVRQRSWSNFVVDGQVFLGGNDPWYHLRQSTYTVNNYPATSPFDPWTGFDTGVHSGQFGTLFDQAIATVSLIIGLGDPSGQLIATVTAFTPVIVGALVAIPTYLIGRRLGGRITGVLAAIVMALLPGLILSRSLVGTADHNIAEPLFMSFAVFALMAAIGVAQRDKPVYEQLREFEYASLRRVLGYGALAGVATALYMYVWPPGILLVGVFGVFVLVQMTSEMADGESPEHLGIVSAVAMTVTGVLMLARLESASFSVSGYSLIQVIFPLAVAGGAVFLAWLAREWDTKRIDPWYYPGAVLATLIVGAGVVSVAIPRLFSLVTGNLLRFVGFSAGAATRTIGEAQPFPLSMSQQYGLSQTEVLFHEYGFTFFLAFGMLAILLLEPLLRSQNNKKIGLAIALPVVTGIFLAAPIVPQSLGGLFGVDPTIISIAVVGSLLALTAVAGTYDGERMLIVVWTVFMLSAAFTQVRFNYYLAVPVAVLSAWLPVYVFRSIGYTIDREKLTKPDWNAYFAIATVLLLLIVPLAVPVGLTNDQGQTLEKQTAWQVGDSTGPGSVTLWEDTLDWMVDNTPEEGNYGGADNADQFEYYGTYEYTDDYDYPEGSYGVMSWWDYGHWITVLGERIPVANPFQQHATEAANYLLADDEETANERLAVVEEDDAKVRYVMVDWQMVEGKFGAPVTFYDAGELSQRDTQTQIYQVNQETGSVQPAATLRTQRYYESQMVRLYNYHGSATDPAPIVVNWDVDTVETANGPVQIPVVPEDGQLVRQDFESVQEAQQYAEEDGSAQVGGFQGIPEERVTALEHYRLVKVNDGPENANQRAVKLFEKVPGATVEGQGPADSEVTAQVEMEIPSRNTTFTYTQHAQTDSNGDFAMTLPYSSTGYDEWGTDEGYTNVSVRATGDYQFSTPPTADENLTVSSYTATADVTEGQVIGEDDSTITVDLEEEVLQEPEGANQTGNETTTTDGNETITDGNESTGDDTETTTDGDSLTTTTEGDTQTTTASESLAPIAPAAVTAPLAPTALLAPITSALPA
ncbi:Dolichol phosphate-mannose mannosyltransferase [Halanaeroarchaeum sp. HSR-CO]|uniref:oligosaccharyl transferase, archaeosortase A system-associated n=1 Tax=Halanaeroarchaeum sp. HSR-CO TaxID=2866382 RepID=UPI00217E1354|nr:oligosaccharyl transferase, archaeosortase A system-associated [Halanaeroarchaeum sp. HSR-CO]UWG48137.1 Dolichol phosphate-mannose mannosyltransferase [Halanaeroarchaeum sp. HSR-CO]